MAFSNPQMHLTTKVFITRKLRGGEEIVREQVIAYLESVKEEATEAVRKRMREGVSRELGYAYLAERDSLVSEVEIEEGNPRLRIVSAVVQAAVDERGRRPGGMPPFGPGSLLRWWVILTLDPDPRKIYIAARGVARAIAERGLPRPLDALRQPFHYGFEAMQPTIVQGLRDAGARATILIQRGDTG